MAYAFDMKMNNRMIIRLSDEENMDFEASAEIAGLSVSAWVRQHLRLAAIQELSRVGRKATFLKPIPINTDGNSN